MGREALGFGSVTRETGLSAGFRVHALQAGGRRFDPVTAHNLLKVDAALDEFVGEFQNSSLL
jgi:hypothetical protein